jgi:Kelch motif protein
MISFLLHLAAAAPESTASARTITLDDRIEAQRRIEQVYWNHRVWPETNTSAKPRLSQVVGDDALRAKVEDSLRKSAALETLWQRPVTSFQLQAELDRLSRDTQAPELLRELYAALGNDPALIAETLARQTLVDRLIREWYASDERFHGEQARRAVAAREGAQTVDELRSMGGEYREITVRKRRPSQPPAHGVPEVSDLDWAHTLDDVARKFRTTSAAIPVRTLSELVEDKDRFYVTTVLSLRDDELTTAVASWPKRSFESWWGAERDAITAAKATTVATYSLARPGGVPREAGNWDGRYGVPPMRVAHVSVWTGTEMIVWGGWDGSPLFDGARYNPAIDSWIPISTGLNAPRAEVQTAVWTGEEMLVWGGTDAPTGRRYDPQTDTWCQMSLAGAPPSGVGFSTVWTGTEMILWGWSSPGVSGGEGAAYDPLFDSWRPTSTGPGTPSPRSTHTAVWTGSEMLVWGGSTTENTGGRYDPVLDRWIPIPDGPTAPSARRFHSAVWTGSEMIVWGGYADGAFLDTGGRFDPATVSWTPTSTGPGAPTARYEHQAVWTGSEMVVWGGFFNDGSWHYLNTGGRYDPASDRWAPTSTGPNVPRGRWSFTGVWTGREMIVWGGRNDRENLSSGGRYVPSSDTWIATSTGRGAPSSRNGHSAVWTGTELIVWGGFDNNDYTNDGGRYDLATAQWTPTSTSGAVPAIRSGHVAVWTGTEMIVWGGGSGPSFSPLNSGGRYDPTMDLWTAMPSALEPRFGHSGVWTGSSMIVWGGFGSGRDALNSGGRFFPSTNVWAPTSTSASAPAPRGFHGAVWTGTEMIVWGGQGSFGGLAYLATGGRYSPAGNSWTATSTAGVPEGRVGHATGWTGSAMVIWGGFAAENCLDSGGRYSPAANTWAATSRGANVPLARFATAAWTGREFIVWGGSNERLTMGTGARYDPTGNRWSTVPTEENTPSARDGHSLTWTGTAMLVWGGYRVDNGVYRYCAGPCVEPWIERPSRFDAKRKFPSRRCGRPRYLSVLP